MLKAAGCKKIITSCAGVSMRSRGEYPEIASEMPFEVVHSSEVIAELLKDGKLRQQKKSK
jgi:Fe-S oxidoreductase